MALPALDQVLGSTTINKSGVTGTITVVLTTTVAAAANTRLVAIISSWTGITVDGSQLKVASVVGSGSRTFTDDKRVLNSANSQDVLELWSVPNLSTFAIGGTVTVTFSPTESVNHEVGGVLVSLISVANVDLTNGGGVDTTASNANQTGASWTTGTATATGPGFAVGGAGNETPSSTTSTPTSGTEIHDLWNSGAQQGIATAYQVVSGAGSVALTGTFSNSGSTATTGGIVVYKAADKTITAPTEAGTGDLVSPTISAGSTETTPAASGTGDLVTPGISAGETVTSPTAAGTGDLVTPAVSGGGSPALDDFNRSDGALGSKWSDNPFDYTSEDTITILSDAAIGGAGAGSSSGNPGGTEASAWYNDMTLVAPMSASYTVTARPSFNSASIIYSGLGFVQAPGTGSASGYEARLRYSTSQDEIIVNRVDSTLQTRILTTTPLGSRLSLGDVVKLTLDASGNLDVLVNGTQVATVSDTTYFNAGQSAFPLMEMGDFATVQSLIQHDDFNATGSPLSTVTAPPASGTGDLVSPTVESDSDPTAPPASATGDLVSPSISAGQTVTTGPAAATGDLVTPADSASSDVVAPAASATGALPMVDLPISATIDDPGLVMKGTGDLVTPMVTGTGDASAASPAMPAAGDLVAPSITASSSPVAPPASATGDLATPSDSASSTIPAPTEAATGDLATPSVSAGATVDAPAEQGTGDAPSPAVSGTSSATVSAPAMGGRGDLVTPGVGAGGRHFPDTRDPTIGLVSPYATNATVAGRATLAFVVGSTTTALSASRATEAAVDQLQTTTAAVPSSTNVFVDP